MVTIYFQTPFLKYDFLPLTTRITLNAQLGKQKLMVLR